MSLEFELLSRTVLLTVGGSRAYGINRPDSDVDVKGVCIPPSRYYTGFLGRFEQAEGSNIDVFKEHMTPDEREVIAATKLEGTVYEIRKFMALAADCNPNILDVLFCRDEEVRVMTPVGAALREARDLFISAKAKHTFSGYAASQLKRIKGHRSWLLDPPKAAPTRAQFGLPERTLIPADQLAAASASVKKQVDNWEIDMTGMLDSERARVKEELERVIDSVVSGVAEDPEMGRFVTAARVVGMDDNLILVLQREREYEAAQRRWKQYQHWKSERNVSRAIDEAKWGFDVKHGAHLFRLLRMGREILETGKVHVWRGQGGPDDADEILSIRRGEWSYERLVEFAEHENALLEEIYKKKHYVVPHQSDRHSLDLLCTRIVEASLASDKG